MENLRIYRITNQYVSYLSKRDEKVQYNKGQRRPYVGVVLYVGQYQYFVPMESPKPNHVHIKAGKHIMKLDGGKLGLLGFNNMIPVPPSAIVLVDIDAEPDEKYAELLRRQASFINRNKTAILSKASETYFSVTNNKNKFLVEISCDFRKLERASDRYNPNHKRPPRAKQFYNGKT